MREIIGAGLMSKDSGHEDPAGPVLGFSDNYVRFESEERLFALPLPSVREVVESSTFSPIPRAPPFTVGLMNHGGRVHTIVDLHALLFGGPGAPREQIVLLDDPSRLLGIAVDSVIGIGSLLIDEDGASFQDKRVTLISLETLVGEVDSAFQSSSMLVSKNLASSPKES